MRKTGVGSPAGGGGSGGSGRTPWLAGRAAGELIASGSHCEPQGKPPAVQGAQGGRPGLRLLGCNARPRSGCCDQAVKRCRMREHAKGGTGGRLAAAGMGAQFKREMHGLPPPGPLLTVIAAPCTPLQLKPAPRRSAAARWMSSSSSSSTSAPRRHGQRGPAGPRPCGATDLGERRCPPSGPFRGACGAPAPAWACAREASKL